MKSLYLQMMMFAGLILAVPQTFAVDKKAADKKVADPQCEDEGPEECVIGNDGGGSYVYAYGIGAYYRNIKNYAARTIEYLASDSASEAEKSRLTSLEEKYKVKIDWKDFASIIRNGKGNPDKVIKSKGPDDYHEPLFFTYSKKNRTIKALKPFFLTFNKFSPTFEEAQEMIRLPLHEASHLFELGVNGDDHISRAFSIDLRRILRKYVYRCNEHSGEPSFDIIRCQDYRDPLPFGERKKLIVSSFTAGGSRENRALTCTTNIRIWAAVESEWQEIGVLGDDQEYSGSREFDYTQLQVGQVAVINHRCKGVYRKAIVQLADEFGHVYGEAAWDFQPNSDNVISMRDEFIRLGDGELIIR